MICGFLGRVDYVRTAAAVVIMHRFTHVLYIGTTRINNVFFVLFTAVGRQMRGFEPSLPFSVFSRFFFVILLGG